MAASDSVNLSGLMDDAKCFAFVRQHRWPAGVQCPGCDSPAMVPDGCDDTPACCMGLESERNSPNPA